MQWFVQLKQALPGYYAPGRPADIVGYLRGSVDPAVWRQMAQSQGRHQMLILGNAEPTQKEWDAAGVGQRGASQPVRFASLAGLIVLYGGFMLRPWGQIHPTTPEALSTGFPASLQSWKRNYAPPRP